MDTLLRLKCHHHLIVIVVPKPNKIFLKNVNNQTFWSPFTVYGQSLYQSCIKKKIKLCKVLFLTFLEQNGFHQCYTNSLLTMDNVVPFNMLIRISITEP